MKRTIVLVLSVGLALLALTPLASAVPAPGKICSGLVDTNCFYCSGNGGSSVATANMCLDDWCCGYHWYHCTLYAGNCYLG